MFSRVWAAAFSAGAFCVFSTGFGAPAASAAEAASDSLDTIVVTAQRREESAQAIGIALSVLSGQSLAEKAIANVNNLQNAVPSLEVEPAFGSGQPQFRLRGVGFIDYTSNNSSPVTVNVDEVAYAFPIQTQGQLFDIDRVEVLRGPQGTLYGRNTTGGAVNFITNRPTPDYHAGVTADFGSHDAFSAEGFVSGPLADTLKGRLSFASDQGGAWQRNRATGQTLGDKDKIAGRGQLEWDPAEGVDLRLTVHLSQDKSDAYGTQLFENFTPAAGGPVIPADTSPYATGWSLRPGFAQTVGISPGSKPSVNNTNNGADLTANIDLGAVTLTSVSAYNTLLRRELGDWDATQYIESDVFFRSDVKVYSQEVRVSSTGTGPFGWVGGVYYSNEKLNEDFYSDFTQRLGGSALTSYTQKGASLGIFGQGNYQITQQLKGIFGLRYEHETRDLIGLNTSFTGVPSLITGGPQSRSLANSDLSGKAALEYVLTDRSLLYASISRGVKSGGFTAHNTVGNPAAVDAFQPEKLLAYEAGVKTEFARMLRLNAAIFYYDYKDEQVLTKVFDPGSQSDIGRFTNAPKSAITGAEVELQWQPAPGLEVQQYVGYKEGKYKSTILSSTLTNFDGKDLSFPKLSYGGDLAYSWAVGEFKIRPDFNYSFHDTYSQYFLLDLVTYKDSEPFTVQSYWLANADISLSPVSGKSWSVALWGHNVFNTRYDLTKNFFLPGTDIAAVGEPTTVGIRFNYAF
jgi:iron complex outermembrane recepter protein